MDGKIGDRIIVVTDKVGVAAREGEILEVIEHDFGTEFLVRWDDGHETRHPAARRERPDRRAAEGRHPALTAPCNESRRGAGSCRHGHSRRGRAPWSRCGR